MTPTRREVSGSVSIWKPYVALAYLARRWELRYRGETLGCVWQHKCHVHHDRNPSEGLNAAVAAELRRERAAQQVTIDTLVERTGLSRSTVLNTLNAKRLLGVEAVASIAQALEVSVTTIFARAEGRISAATPDAAFA